MSVDRRYQLKISSVKTLLLSTTSFDAVRYREEGGSSACVDVDECLAEDGEERLCDQGKIF